MAAFLIQGTDILEVMLKLKFILSIVLLLVIQQVYSSLPITEQSSSIQDVITESSFEANDSHPGIFGDVPSGRIMVNSFSSETECHPGFSKSKNVFTGLIFSVTKSKLKFVISQSPVFTRYSAVYIPIYLQTASFLL